MLAFTHIPKTGGTTLIRTLKRYFGLTHQDWTLGGVLDVHLKSASGHELHPHRFPHKTYQWITLLREPTSRYFSHFLHLARNGLTPARNLQEWAEQNPAMSNLQVRRIAGREDLDEAKRILKQYYFAIGITEHFSSSLSYFEEKLNLPGFRAAQSPRRNLAPNEPFKQELSRNIAHCKTVSEKYNGLDLELYHWVRENLPLREKVVRARFTQLVYYKKNTTLYTLWNHPIPGLIWDTISKMHTSFRDRHR